MGRCVVDEELVSSSLFLISCSLDNSFFLHKRWRNSVHTPGCSLWLREVRLSTCPTSILRLQPNNPSCQMSHMTHGKTHLISHDLMVKLTSHMTYGKTHLTASFLCTCGALDPNSVVILEGGTLDSSSHTSSITFSLSERSSSNSTFNRAYRNQIESVFLNSSLIPSPSLERDCFSLWYTLYCLWYQQG